MNEEVHTNEWYEKEYNASNWSKKHSNRKDVLDHFLNLLTIKSKEAIDTTPHDINVSYGERNYQKIDYFYGGKAKEKSNNKPVFVYIHGGYWQEGSKELYSMVATPFTKHNFNVAVVGYDLAPACSISGIIVDVSDAISAIHSHFNGSKLIICGHSAGGFLAAVIAKAKPTLIQDAVLISGVYDLSPLLKTSINDALQLSMEQARDLSSMVFGYNVNVPAHIYVGQDESSESKRQSQLYHEKLIRNKATSYLTVVPNEDHFSIIESFIYEDSVLCRDMLKLAQ